MKRNLTLHSRHDNLNIAVLAMEPGGTPESKLMLSHGMCGCKERFLSMMEYLASKNILCISWDHRGHGASVRAEEDRGYMYPGGYDALVEDMEMVIKWASDTYPGIPVYLLGHSMGSLAVRTLTRRDDSALSGLIVCGSPSRTPVARLVYALSSLMCHGGMGRMRAGLLQRIVSDRYNRRFASEGYQAWTCSDPAEREAFAANPLCNFTITLNFACGLMGLMCEAYDEKGWKVSNPHLPVLFISGADDPCMISERNFHNSALAMVRAGYDNVSSVLFPYMRHEVLNEKGKTAVWDEIYDFIAAN